MTHRSIATVCLSGTLQEKLEAAAAAGFDGVEIFEPDLVVCDLTPSQVRGLAADLGLSIDMYQPFRDLDGVTEDVFRANLTRLERKFRLMQELGASLMLVCSNVGTATIDDDQVCADQLRRAGELAERHSIRLAYEALAWGRFVSTYEHAARIVALADHPAVGTCLDSFHILSRGGDPAGFSQLPAGSIFFLQLADAPALEMDVLSWSRHHRVFPGQGDWDLPGFLAEVLRAGYTGPLSLEVFNDVFRQADQERTAFDARRSLQFLEERTALRLQGEPAAKNLDLSTLPQVADPAAIDHVEITAGDVAEVERLLAALGFAECGRHQSKPVRLWIRDRVNVVVTPAGDPQEPAHLSTIGFRVDDPHQSAQRAAQLGVQAVPRHTGDGEEVLYGVRSPDGTEVFFGRPSPDGVAPWLQEFERSGERPTLRTSWIDHVNLVADALSFDETVLFYSSVLSLDPQSRLDVASPLGLVRSQVMQSDDGVIRLALNVVPQFTRGVSGLRRAQHIAVTTDNLVNFARLAVTRGLRFLQIPANYYEDLQARFDLDDAFVDQLQELNLLYDREGDSEFLHVYTPTVGNVFFEVVERRGAYQGFGAPNAPVRLATQLAHRRCCGPTGGMSPLGPERLR